MIHDAVRRTSVSWRVRRLLPCNWLQGGLRKAMQPSAMQAMQAAAPCAPKHPSTHPSPARPITACPAARQPPRLIPTTDSRDACTTARLPAHLVALRRPVPLIAPPAVASPGPLVGFWLPSSSRHSACCSSTASPFRHEHNIQHCECRRWGWANSQTGWGRCACASLFSAAVLRPAYSPSLSITRPRSSALVLPGSLLGLSIRPVLTRPSTRSSLVSHPMSPLHFRKHLAADCWA